jgi:DNA polymerase-1
LLKLAMLKVATFETRARMVLTVHDELVFEVQDHQVDAAKADIRYAMESAHALRVPLVVTVSSGRTWADA